MPETVARALHVAILGCGVAAELNGPVLAGLGVACSYASRDLARARRFAERLRGRGTYGSYEAALSAPDVDAVLIATPPSLHAELALAALLAGKHVIVEKPPFMRSTDFAPVESAARSARRRVLVAENYHYKPLAVALRRLLAEHAVGELLFVHVNALKRQAVSGWRDDPAVAGGGALFEGGIHWVSFMSHLGPVVRDARGFVSGSRADERGITAVFQYEGGAVGTLLYSWNVPSALGGMRNSRIYGREGVIGFESNGLAVWMWGRRKGVIFPGVRDLVGRRAMWRDYVRVLQGEGEPAYDLTHARRDLELVERIYATIP
ncbi:MAG TPA: Gfo/Idh/MocA family oxidoreductase [Candidatus Eisenbacteria bacterium]|nr:Gfo/Idh/MocA family oxidoreductase [Candidatus Eisenbacteria bacterium]